MPSWTPRQPKIDYGPEDTMRELSLLILGMVQQSSKDAADVALLEKRIAGEGTLLDKKIVAEADLFNKKATLEKDILTTKIEHDKNQDLTRFLLDQRTELVGRTSDLENSFRSLYNISSENATTASLEILDGYTKDNQIDIDNIQKNITNRILYNKELENSLTDLAMQAQVLRKEGQDFAGINRILEVDEYEKFVEHATKSIDEGGLGWSGTWGADKAFYNVDPAVRATTGIQASKDLASPYIDTATSQFTVMKELFNVDNVEDYFEYEMAGQTVKPDETMLTNLQQAFIQTNDYKNFLRLVENEPGGRYEKFLSQNPAINIAYTNLKEADAKVTQIMSDVIAKSEDPDATPSDLFKVSIKDMNTKDELFTSFKNISKQVPVKDHQIYFKIIEDKLGGGDLYDDYLKWNKEDEGTVNVNIGGINIPVPQKEVPVDLEGIDEDMISSEMERLAKSKGLTTIQASDDKIKAQLRDMAIEILKNRRDADVISENEAKIKEIQSKAQWLRQMEQRDKYGFGYAGGPF